MARARRAPLVERRTIRGEPVAAHDQRVTPISRVTRVSMAGAGFAYERPIAVEIEREGRVRRLAIRDRTRLAIAGMIAASLVVRALVRRRERTAE